LRIGGATTIDLDAYNSISFTIDFNKLLVPTPPIDTIIDGEHVVLYGKDNNVGIVQGMVQSFNDARMVLVKKLMRLIIQSALSIGMPNNLQYVPVIFMKTQIKGTVNILQLV
jgi:hypothetical protein